MKYTEAMIAARKGATILLRPGVYEDVLCFSEEGVTVSFLLSQQDVLCKIKAYVSPEAVQLDGQG